ncbi:MAG: hypothetical protein QOE72_2198, partial [Chloroflexota bacterium]|nr:hypothetical protein [Chloroflexota bacterium]
GTRCPCPGRRLPASASSAQSSWREFCLLSEARVSTTFISTPCTGVVWFTASTVLVAAGSYGMAETLAHRIRTQEQYVRAAPAIALLPWFVARAAVA